MIAAVLSIMVLAIFALLGGAAWLWRRGGAKKQVALMVVLAAVIAGNVAILVMPDASGTAPLGRAPE